MALSAFERSPSVWISCRSSGTVAARLEGWVGAAQDGDFVPEHEELDVLGGGRAARQQDQPEHLPEHQVQQPQRHAGIMPNQQSPLVNGQARLLAPHTLGRFNQLLNQVRTSTYDRRLSHMI